jgi:predicted lipopolysaccharide heptosyltransferase III
MLLRKGSLPLPDLNGRPVLAARYRSIGDALLMTPALHAIKERYPDCHLCVLVERPIGGLFAGNPDVDEVISVIGRRELAVRGRERRWHYIQRLREIRRRRFAAVFDFHGGPRSGIMSWLSAAPVRVGHAEYAHTWAYTHLVDLELPRDALHSVERQLALVEGVGIVPRSRQLVLGVPPRAREYLQQHYPRLMRDDGGPLVTIHLWSHTAKKTWQAEKIADVADALTARHQARIALVGGKAEEALAEAAAQIMRVEPELLLGGAVGLPEIAALLERASLHIGNDSGPTHMAGALGIPIVVLFGGSNPRVWHPWGTTYRLLHRPQPCAPCRGPTPCERGFACIRDITPQEVIAAAEELLALVPARSGREAS